MAARLQAQPDSLWARVIKGIYFPRSSFLAAVKGGRPSWAWHSLLVGRDAVFPGAVWVIGDGRSIRPFSDAWVPGFYDHKLGLHPITDHQANTFLAEWIDQEGRSWKEQTVREAVSDQETDKVLSITIPLLTIISHRTSLDGLMINRGTSQQGRPITSSMVGLAEGRLGSAHREEATTPTRTCGRQSGSLSLYPR